MVSGTDVALTATAYRSRLLEVETDDLIDECKRRGLKVFRPERVKVINHSSSPWDAEQFRWMKREKSGLFQAEQRHLTRGLADFMYREKAVVFVDEPVPAARESIAMRAVACVVMPKGEDDVG